MWISFITILSLQIQNVSTVFISHIKHIASSILCSSRYTYIYQVQKARAMCYSMTHFIIYNYQQLVLCLFHVILLTHIPISHSQQTVCWQSSSFLSKPLLGYPILTIHVRRQAIINNEPSFDYHQPLLSNY